MEKFFKWSILDEIYDLKSDQFSENILKEMKKQGKELKSLEIGERLTEKIKENVADEENRKELLSLLNKYELKSGNEEDVWNRMYYKLGFYDCTDMKDVLQNKIKDSNNKEMENGFLDDFTDNFMDYLENNRMERLRKEEGYLEIENKINEIKDNNPKVRIFMDNREKVKLSDEELDKILEILNLQGDLENFEYKEIFKLGARELLVFLKQMELL